MSCGRLTEATQKRLTTGNAASMSYEPFTSFVPAVGLDDITAVLKARAMTDALKTQVAVQLAATRTDQPSAWATLGTLQTAAGEYCTGSTSITSVTSNMFVRFGVGYQATTGGTLAAADVLLQVAYDACGRIVGTSQFQAMATDTTSRFQPMTDWMPTHTANKVRAAIIAQDVSDSTLRYQLAYQTAATSPEGADQWATGIDSGWHTGAGELCTGDLTLTYSSKMWVRFGIAYSLTTGTALSRADIMTIIGVRT